jgi:hypothetical protein
VHYFTAFIIGGSTVIMVFMIKSFILIFMDLKSLLWSSNTFSNVFRDHFDARRFEDDLLLFCIYDSLFIFGHCS